MELNTIGHSAPVRLKTQLYQEKQNGLYQRLKDVLSSV